VFACSAFTWFATDENSVHRHKAQLRAMITKGRGLLKFMAQCEPTEDRTLICGSKIHPGTDKPDRRKLYPNAFGIDMQEGEGVDLVHDLEEPLDMYFDHVDCVSTLEHVRRPWLFAANVNRMLIDGGTILVMVPWVWREHGYPNDYQRFTESGIRNLFPQIVWRKSSFIVEERLVKSVPKITVESIRYLARSELVMFGMKKL
jgi:SAM-dependent methyltransferase